MVDFVSGASFGLSVVGGLRSKRAANRNRRRNNAIQRLEQRRADLDTARERTQQVRQARILRSRALAQGTGGAGTGGSGLIAARAGIAQQFAQNQQFLNQNQEISRRITERAIGRRSTLRGKILKDVEVQLTRGFDSSALKDLQEQGGVNIPSPFRTVGQTNNSPGGGGQ